MSIEAKTAMRSTARSSSTPWKKRSGYAGYGLILGLVMVLLYLMVSAQLSYDPHEASYAGASISSTAEMVPARRQRGGHEENDVWSRGMEEPSSRKEEAKPRTEPATARLQGAQERDEQEWPDKNPMEEQSVGNERNSHNWEQTQQPADKDTVELEFGGGTDDFNNIAHTKPICDTSFGKYDICELAGNARASGGAAATVTLVSPRAPLREWTIKPYSRKYLDGLKAVKVRSVSIPEHASQCTVRLNIPVMVIELGGLTGNYWHDFTDVLIPLFIGARRHVHMDSC